MKQKTAMASVLLMSLILVAGFIAADDNGYGAAHSNTILNANADVGSSQLVPFNAHAVAKAGTNLVSIEDFNNQSQGDFNSTGIERESADIDASAGNNALEATFAQVSLGQGWATNNTSGSFAKIMWVEKTFANTTQGTNATANDTNGTNQTNSTSPEMTIVMGSLKIGSQIYNLNLSSEANNSMDFGVSSNRGNVTGTLDLNQQISLMGFSVWSGNLALSNGQEYQVNVATQNSRIKSSVPSVNASAKGEFGLKNAASSGQGKKIGLFERIRELFGGN